MAASASLLTADGSTANPADTGVVSPAVDALLLLVVAATKTGAPAPAAADVTVTGAGLTWEPVDDGIDPLTQDYRARRRLYLFRAQGTPTSGALTLTYGGNPTFQEWGWVLLSVSGAVVGGNGAAAIGGVGSASVETGSTNIGLTITADPDTGDITVAAAGIEESGGAPGISAPAGVTELSSIEHANVRHLVVGADPGAGTGWTFGPWSSSGNGAGALGVHVLAAADGGRTGSAASVTPAGIAAAAGTVEVSGSAAATVPAGQASAAGTVAVTGTVASVAPAGVAASEGAVGNPPITGAAASAAPAAVASGSGTVAVGGSGVAVAPAGIASGSAVHGVVVLTGTADIAVSRVPTATAAQQRSPSATAAVPVVPSAGGAP